MVQAPLIDIAQEFDCGGLSPKIAIAKSRVAVASYNSSPPSASRAAGLYEAALHYEDGRHRQMGIYLLKSRCDITGDGRQLLPIAGWPGFLPV